MLKLYSLKVCFYYTLQSFESWRRCKLASSRYIHIFCQSPKFAEFRKRKLIEKQVFVEFLHRHKSQNLKKNPDNNET